MKYDLTQCDKCKLEPNCSDGKIKVRIDAYGRCMDFVEYDKQSLACKICKKVVNIGEQLSTQTNEVIGYDFACECGVTIHVPSTDINNAILMYSRITGMK